MAEDPKERLAAALELLAANLRPLPPPRTAMNINVTGGGPGSSTVGFSQSLVATGDGQVLIGVQNTVSDVHVAQVWEATTGELKAAAAAVRADKAPAEWLSALVKRVKAMGDKAIDAGVVHLAEQALDAFTGL